MIYIYIHRYKPIYTCIKCRTTNSNYNAYMMNIPLSLFRSIRKMSGLLCTIRSSNLYTLNIHFKIITSHTFGNILQNQTNFSLSLNVPKTKSSDHSSSSTNKPKSRQLTHTHTHTPTTLVLVKCEN